MKSLYKNLLLSILAISFQNCKTEEPQTPPTVNTVAATNIALSKATIGGEVVSEGFSAASERGLVLSETNPKPSVSDTKFQSGYGIGIFSKDLENLKVNTKYYFAAFATNTKGTSYGETLNFTTADYKLASLINEAPKNITFTTVQLTGTISDDGGAAVSERGFVLGTSTNPTLVNTKIQNGTGLGTFSTIVTQLKDETIYYVRAYAINGKGTVYSNEISFSTLGYKTPTVETGSAVSIGTQNVTLNGDITNNGGIDLIEKGFIFGANLNVGLSDQKAISSTKDGGKYAMVITNLKPNTKYYYKSYASNAKGATLGLENSFSTLPSTLSIVVTNDITDITETSVRAGLEISNDGGSPITEYGVCISSTNSSPTISDRKVIFGSNAKIPLGEMNPIYGLSNSTKYYLRGYAINAAGISYGVSRSFTTSSPFSNQIKNGLVAYYPFNGNANDESGNNNNGNVLGAILTSDKSGKINSAYNFNGNSKIDLSKLPTTGSNDFSVSVWLNISSNNNSRRGIIGWGSDVPWGSTYLFINDNGNLEFDFAYNAGPISQDKLPLNTWINCIIVCNSGLVSIYINGNLATSPLKMYPNIVGSNKTIGTTIDNSGSHFFIGNLDEIMIFNRPLNLAEISYIFTDGKIN